jgi:hypothetical protein
LSAMRPHPTAITVVDIAYSFPRITLERRRVR